MPKKLSKEEACINWQQDAAFIERCIRAFNPWPVSYFKLADLNIKVWKAEVLPNTAQQSPGMIIQASKAGLDIATGNGMLRIKQLQLPGKKAMSFADVLNARQDLFLQGNILP